MTEVTTEETSEETGVGEEINIEIRSLRSCMHALEKLKSPAARKRVLDWVNAKVNEELLESLSQQTLHG